MPEPPVFTDAGEASLDAARAALAAGHLVTFPTDTVFGLAADPDVEGATRLVFATKRRARALTLPVLVADPEQARTVAILDARAERLAATFWPGALTLVLPRTEACREWDLGEERASVAVRIPDHPVAAALLERTGPLAVTSANISGEPTPPECEGLFETFGDSVAAYLCWGPAPAGRASTVIDLTGHQARVQRSGDVSAEELGSVLGEHVEPAVS